MAPGLLDGIRVLDFTIWRPGPYATQLLSELGADVYKVEPPGGDPMRAYPGLFEALSRNKRSTVLDLKTADGKRRALELAAQADVVVEAFRPGVAARLGIGYEEVRAVNATVVYCSLSGMGQTGPLSFAPGHDANFQAWGGGLSPEGLAPVNGPLPIADLSGGLAAAYAICAALVHRAHTGEGEHIDVAMADVIATWTGGVAPAARDVDPSARGVPGYGIFPTADGGYVTLGIITEDHFWSSLCDALGLVDARGLTFVERMAQLASLQPRVAQAIAESERDELVDTLLTLGIPIAPVLTRQEMLALDHFRARGVAGDGWTGHPVRFVDHPAAPGTRAPEIGEHQDEGFKDTASH